MRPVSVVSGTMVPIDRADIDTDQIIPQTFLKRVERTGYGDFLFYNWAHDEAGNPRPDFVLHDPARRGAKVLVAGPNFGCGSSREHAPWAIQQWGFEAVIAPSFADIFRNNSLNNGMLLVELPAKQVARLVELAQDPAAMVTIDLPAQTVTSEGFTARFEIDPDVKQRLIQGLDPIDVTLTHDPTITAFERSRPTWMPVAG